MREMTCAAIVCLIAAGSATAQPAIDGEWSGAIQVMGREIGIAVTFASEAGGLAATIDIPEQGAADIRLTSVSYELPSVHFELQAGPGLAVFDGTVHGDTIRGDFAQAGAQGQFQLIRAASGSADAGPAEEAAREEEAQDESLPYQQHEVTFRNGEVELAGTLTVPASPGPHPAIVMITGSGPQNRDQELFGFRPFRIIADYLTRVGVAVLRYDDRGVGGSTGSVFDATVQDFASDALAAVELLAGRSEVDDVRIGLVGHSEGAIVAPMAAARSDRVAFLVLLAPPAVPGDELLEEQSALIARANGAADEEIEQQREFQHRLFATLRADTGWAALEARLQELIREGLASLPVEQRQGIVDPESYAEAAAGAQLRTMRSRWFRSFLDHDPAAVLERATVPVLAVFGGRDLQVPPALNREPMVRALDAAPTEDYSIEVLAEANHLFQRSVTGSPSEYAQLEKRFVPGLLELIGEWLARRLDLETPLPEPPEAPQRMTARQDTVQQDTVEERHSAEEPDEPARRAAIEAAREWLALTDSRKYGESWDEAAELFQSALTRSQWEQRLTSVRGPLGALVSRELVSAQYTTSLPNAPPGAYVVIRFSSEFENRPGAVETVVPMREDDGSWRVSGYFIQ